MKLTSSPNSYSTPPLRFNPSITFFEATFDRTLSFLNTYRCPRSSSSLASRDCALSLILLGVPLRSPSLFCTKLFFGPFSLMLHLVGFLSLALPSRLSRYHRLGLVLNCITLLLLDGFLPSLRVTPTHFAQSS